MKTFGTYIIGDEIHSQQPLMDPRVREDDVAEALRHLLTGNAA